MPLLQEEAIRVSDKVPYIMAFDVNNFGDKICETVPQVCPGKTATYLVDLSKLAHPDDIVRDSYGSWGSNSGDTMYYAIDTELRSVRKQNCGKRRKMPEDAKVDFKIRRRFYKHPVAKDQFKKTIFIGYFGEYFEVPKWAIISYEWLCSPFDFSNKPHGSSKDQSKPFQPTWSDIGFPVRIDGQPRPLPVKPCNPLKPCNTG